MAALKARDELFDNASLKYALHQHVEIPPFFQGAPPFTSSSPEATTVTYNAQLTVRGNDVTLEHQSDPAAFPKEIKPGSSVPAAYSKRSNAGGIRQEFSSPSPLSQANDARTLEITPPGEHEDREQRERLETEWSLGFGFGKRIKTISAAESNSAGDAVYTGVLRLGAEPDSSFTLALDSNLIVRSATISKIVGPVHNQIDIATSGTVSAGGMFFPKSGSFRHVNRIMVDGAVVSPETLVGRFEVEFQEARFHLSDAEYEALTSMEVPDGTMVEDRTVNISYKKGPALPAEVPDLNEIALVSENIDATPSDLSEAHEVDFDSREPPPKVAAAPADRPAASRFPWMVAIISTAAFASLGGWRLLRKADETR